MMKSVLILDEFFAMTAKIRTLFLSHIKITNYLTLKPGTFNLRPNITDEYFSDKCAQLYKNFLQKIQKIEINLSDSRAIQLAETLFLIHEFMTKNEKGLDFLGCFISKS